MSFIGAVAASVRQVLADSARSLSWPCLVIGAGNFTVPSVLRSAGFSGQITACDVSLYSSALGAYLSGQELPVRERQDVPAHLAGLLRPGSPAVLAASIALLMDLREVWQAKNPYQERVVNNYRRLWDSLLEKTLEKLGRFKEHLGPISYQVRDGFDLLKNSSREQAVFAFPPTYKGGYERLERLLGAVAEWEPPIYQEMSDKDLELYELIAEFPAYYVVLEKDLPDVYAILGEPTAVLPRSRDKLTYIIAREGKKRLSAPSPNPLRLVQSGRMTSPSEAEKFPASLCSLAPKACASMNFICPNALTITKAR